MNTPDFKNYLGDGVYASLENGMIKLEANALYVPNVIYLEPEVFFALTRWEKRVCEEIQKTKTP